MAIGAVIGGISGGVGAGVGGYVGGQVCSQLTGVVAGGAAAGATAGGLNAAYYGGNIGDAMLKGAAGGALGGLVGYGLGYGLSGLPDPLRYGGQVLGGGLIGGGLQELFGGHFSDGFMTGAVGAAVSIAIYEVANNSNVKSSQADQYKSKAEADLIVNTGQHPDDTSIILVGGGPGPGNPTIGFRNDKDADMLRDMGRVLNDAQQKAFGEKNSKYGDFCKEYLYPDRRQFYTRPDSPNPNPCVIWERYKLLKF
jgi:hypothetical protein